MPPYRKLSHLFVACLLLSAIAILRGEPAQAGSGRFIGAHGANVLIVFVHGIGGDGTTTWRSEKAYWPELVKADPVFAGSDVYVYDYESSAVGSSPSIAELARNLRDNLNLPSGANISSYDKIVFIGHSLGGLIIRQYLSEDARHHRNIAGLFLFASPMEGSYYAKLAVFFGSVTVREMQSSGGAESFVTGLRDRWLESRPQISIDSWCAYERRPMGPLVVVNSDSATKLCNRAARSDPASNHQSLVKPTGLDDVKHTILRTWFDEAIPARESRAPEGSMDSVFANCSESFYGADMQSAMLGIASELGITARLSQRLPIDYIPAVPSLIWKRSEPRTLVIHLSCFERRPSTQQSQVNRTTAFIRLLRDLKDTKVRIVVYSRAFRTEPLFVQKYIPKDLAKHYTENKRLHVVPINSDRLFSSDKKSRKLFHDQLAKAQE